MVVRTRIERLNELLYRKGWTKRAFAKAARIGEVTAQQICNGQRNPSAPVAKKITDALEVEFDEIFAIEKTASSRQ
ncbi:helix-turn-helix transcriptional regulator [Brevibacillus brevis]|nr:helix-turn-helix transcriptional regulator [Brevibacillus brevis]